MCSKSKGSYKTHGKINQNLFENNVEFRAINCASLQDSCSNTVLTASLGHFYRTAVHTHIFLLPWTQESVTSHFQR